MITLDEKFINELTQKVNGIYIKCCAMKKTELAVYLSDTTDIRYGVVPIDPDAFSDMFSCRLLRHFDNKKCQIKRLKKNLNINAVISNYSQFFFDDKGNLLRSEFQIRPGEKIIIIYISKEFHVAYRSVYGDLYLYGAEVNEYDDNNRITKSESIVFQSKLPVGIYFCGEYYEYIGTQLIGAEKLTECFFPKKMDKYIYENTRKPSINSYSFKYNNGSAEVYITPGSRVLTLKESELKKIEKLYAEM